MKVITHRSKEALENSAKQFNVDIYESLISYSFYVYGEGELGKRNAIEFHQYLK